VGACLAGPDEVGGALLVDPLVGATVEGAVLAALEPPEVPETDETTEVSASSLPKKAV